METVCFSETLASANMSIWHQNPEEHHHSHHHENLKSHKLKVAHKFDFSAPDADLICLGETSFVLH
jgi:hypothetical protein